MPIDLARCRKLLDALDLDTLFVEVLGWDRHRATLKVATKHGEVSLRGFAEKRGFAAFVCEASGDGRIPDHAVRAQIDREVTKSAREHIIVYTNKQKTEQVWQWVRRGHGADGQRQPLKRREFNWRSGQASGLLVERVLPSICFSLGEEEKLTLPEVTSRASAAFDVEKVTKKFFERFQTEHKAFHKFIDGIEGVADKDWYASVMLNRLMFCYFIQKKGLLDGDHDYLRNRLGKLQSTKGKDNFWSFYRQFLLRLFHEGLSTKANQRAKELDALIGKIPYLNGGLFDVHELETRHKDIKIPDSAFERLFKFFDEYTWHLDDRPLTQGNEINPDVLGYIFEKYINQKQMGAYYTKEDITEYISKNTIIPFILDQAAKNCAIAFKASESGSVWRLLKNDPDRYIYDAVLHGVIDDQGKPITLPAEIEAGVKDVAKRGGWNKPAAAPFALPTETWREHIARRQRCLELREKLTKGEVQTVNDLVTLNLDIRQFAEDVIVNAEGPDLLRAVWKAVESVTVLDPTCGSGAFLFAALNILEPLYEACLDRMESFLDDLNRAEAAGEKVHADKFKDFKEILRQVELHPNTRYFILKSIIVSNLYGVDIMEEACEICKLRLFLKLVAQVEEGVGGIEKIEPLPDIDFNIRAGNTLVGFTSLAAIEKAAPTFLASVGFVDAIKERAEQAATAFRLFREMQTKQGVGSKELAEGKQLVREKLKTLHEELDRYLASEYEVNPDKPKLFAEWRKSHEPFHWFVDFYSIMASGGFDVVVGNPPYVEYSQVRDQYTIGACATTSCANLFAFVIERSVQLMRVSGRMGMIIPISAFANKSMTALQDLLRPLRPQHIASFHQRPAQLFDDVLQRLSIVLVGKSSSDHDPLLTTAVTRWFREARGNLFHVLGYAPSPSLEPQCVLKFGIPMEAQIVSKLMRHQPIRRYLKPDGGGDTNIVAYRTAGGGYWLTFLCSEFESASLSNKTATFVESVDSRAMMALLSSTLFWWYYFTRFDLFNLKDYMIFGFPFDYPKATETEAKLVSLGEQLQSLLLSGAVKYVIHSKTRGDQATYKYDNARAKPLLDQIDAVLAEYYGFSPEELDFIINYDIKYRMGTGPQEE